MARPDSKENGAAVAAVVSNGPATSPTIDQVRELLFGENHRSNEQQHRDLEASVEALRRDMQERFSLLETRLADVEREAERRHATSIDGIGAALSDLGAHVRKLAEPRSRK